MNIEDVKKIYLRLMHLRHDIEDVLIKFTKPEIPLDREKCEEWKERIKELEAEIYKQ